MCVWPFTLSPKVLNVTSRCQQIDNPTAIDTLILRHESAKP
jgi:hypothetical protein